MGRTGAFQHKINKKKLNLHTILENARSIQNGAVTIDDYKKVLYGWAKFLKMPESLETKLEVEI